MTSTFARRVGLAACVAVLGLTSLDARAAAPAPDRVSPDQTRIQVAIVMPGPLPFDALRRALGVRLPRLLLLPYERRSFELLHDVSFAYVELAPGAEPADALDITVILTDGRSYGRRFVPDPDDPVRDAATMLANTLAAIEEERVNPIREDAEIPVPRDDDDDDDDDRPTADPAACPSEARDPRATRWALGVSPRLGTLLGVAPRPAGTFGGGTAALGLTARAPVGALAAVAVRWTGLRDEQQRLVRLRVLLAGGYAWRRRSFELIALVGAAFEPWFVDVGATRLRPLREDGRPPGPLLTAVGRLGPGLLLEPAATPSFALRLGLFAELAVGALARGGVGRVLVESGDDPSHALGRLGGLELSSGLDATLWWSLPRIR